MNDSNAHETDANTAADDAEQIRSINDIRSGENEVRYYSKDGYLYAYREDDEHVIVSRGNKAGMQWTERVPAERGAVIAGEELWTIPDNWKCRVNINGAAQARYAIYHIPETGVDVLVTVPHKNHLVDACYRVKRVGEIAVTYADENEIAWNKLEDIIEKRKKSNKISSMDPVTDALETLDNRRRIFESKFEDGVEMYAEEAVFDRGHEPVRIQQWTTDPWGDYFEVDPLISDLLGIDGETLEGVMTELDEWNVIPRYPTVRVDVEEGKNIPDGFNIRALAESGASGSETVDYLITEHYDAMSQSDWAKIRGRTSSTISKNVSGAKREFSK